MSEKSIIQCKSADASRIATPGQALPRENIRWILPKNGHNRHFSYKNYNRMIWEENSDHLSCLYQAWMGLPFVLWKLYENATITSQMKPGLLPHNARTTGGPWLHWKCNSSFIILHNYIYDHAWAWQEGPWPLFLYFHRNFTNYPISINHLLKKSIIPNY